MENITKGLILPSFYQIGDEVDYKKTKYDYSSNVDKRTKIDAHGVVVGIKFTKSAVSYKVLDDSDCDIEYVESIDMIYPEVVAA